MADMKIAMDDFREALKIHEFSSTLVPGVFSLYGLNLIYPNLGSFVSNNISIGSLLIFLLLSYGAGHLIQSLGNFIEIYIIEPVFGDLRKLKTTKKVEKDMIRTFKNHKKVCRGVASSLSLLLFLSWINGVLNMLSIYSFILITAIFSLFWYMRRYERNELGI